MIDILRTNRFVALRAHPLEAWDIIRRESNIIAMFEQQIVSLSQRAMELQTKIDTFDFLAGIRYAASS